MFKGSLQKKSLTFLIQKGGGWVRGGLVTNPPPKKNKAFKVQY